LYSKRRTLEVDPLDVALAESANPFPQPVCPPAAVIASQPRAAA